MKILVIKTSSMGDIIHTLPALTEAGKIFPSVRFDWVVEENFAEIPAWHPRVNKVIPIALRRWRKNPIKALSSGEWKNFKKQLQQEQYDYVIDAQGLLKSAWLTLFARGKRCGLNRQSVWEPLAAIFYQNTYAVFSEQHAVTRVRQLFARILGYELQGEVDYGIDKKSLQCGLPQSILFLHGTTWSTKHYPENYWCELAKLITQAGWKIQIPWGNQQEYDRAQRIAAVASNIQVLPKLNLQTLTEVLKKAKGAIAVDTGLGHLAAALGIPTLSLYGSTDPKLTGAIGVNQSHLTGQFSCAPCLKSVCMYQGPHHVEPPCFASLTPMLVWENFKKLLCQQPEY